MKTDPFLAFMALEEIAGGRYCAVCTIIFFNDSGLTLNRRGCQAVKYFRVRGINYLQMLLDRKVELST